MRCLVIIMLSFIFIGCASKKGTAYENTQDYKWFEKTR